MDDKKVENLIESYRKYAEANGFKLNPDKKVVERLVRGLLANEKKYGAKYCPCRRVAGNKEEDQPKICLANGIEKKLKKMAIASAAYL